MPGRKARLTQGKILTEKQWRELHKELLKYRDAALFQKKNGGRDLKFVRDYYLLSIAYMTGLRITELSKLDWRDVSADYWLMVRAGKGSKPRTIYFGPKTKRLFDEYRAFLRDRLRKVAGDKDPIFFSQKKKRLGRNGIHHRMKYWLKKAGISENLTFHSLRHGFATRMLNSGIKIHDLKEIMGHANIATTSVYLHFTEESREAFKRLL